MRIVQIKDDAAGTIKIQPGPNLALAASLNFILITSGPSRISTALSDDFPSRIAVPPRVRSRFIGMAGQNDPGLPPTGGGIW